MDDKKQNKTDEIEEIEDIEQTTENEEAVETKNVSPKSNEVDTETKEAATVEIEHWKNKYLRALADYENLERRSGEQIVRMSLKAKATTLNKFLDVLDTLDQAEIFIKDQGLKMVKDNFLKVLKSEGIEEIEVLNKEYDPYTAECIEVVEDPKQKDKVVEVLSKGYKLHDEIIRVAKVKVAK